MRARNALSESPSILGCSGRRTSTRMYSQLGRAIHVALSPRQPDRVAGPARWGLPVWRPSCPEASGAAKSGVIRVVVLVPVRFGGVHVTLPSGGAAECGAERVCGAAVSVLDEGVHGPAVVAPERGVFQLFEQARGGFRVAGGADARACPVPVGDPSGPFAAHWSSQRRTASCCPSCPASSSHGAPVAGCCASHTGVSGGRCGGITPMAVIPRRLFRR